jgi:hypothetical protein
MDTARLPEQVATRHHLLDLLSRAYVDLYYRAAASTDRPRLIERVFERGWERLLHGSPWDDTPVSTVAQQAVADLIERARYVDDQDGLIAWLDTLPATAAAYLEPARYEMRLSAEFPGVQTALLAVGAASGFVAAVAESSRYKVEFVSGDRASLDRDRQMSERDLVAA